jgi:LmbE family N-acetylglucosaminyl deacetylase
VTDDASPVTLDLPIPERALAIGAHPDDIEFGCGATLAKWAAAGTLIRHLVLTDGSRGTWDPSTDRYELVVRRQAEQRAASRALGGTGDVIFLGWPDGELESGLRQRWQVCFEIRRFRPDVVLGHDPWRPWRLHPDHRAAGFLTTDGIVAARDPLFFPEQGEAPHRPSVLLLFDTEAFDHVEAVAGFEERKLEALLCHRSQLETTMRIVDEGNHAEVERFRAEVTERLQTHGKLAGVPAGEAFKRIDRT